MSELRIERVWKEYGDQIVLEDVSLTVASRAFVALVGPSGCGKSTFLRMLLGQERPTKGKILLDGVPLRELDPDELRREIGFVPQESLLFSETLAANIAYGVSGDGAADGGAEGVPARLEEAVSGSVEPTGRDLVAWAADIAHLTETVAVIEKALDSQFIYNAKSIGGGSSGAIIILGDETRNEN